MNRLAPPFRGRLTAAAFVVDPGLVGAAEARRRVLALWRRGATLRWVDAHRWLLTLPDPVSVRSELAPGLPLVAAGGGYAPPGTGDDVPAGSVRLVEGGRVADRLLAALPAVDVAAWVATGGLAHVALVPVEPVPPLVAPPPAPEPAAAVDLRARAAVAEPTPKAKAALGDDGAPDGTTRRGGRRRRRGGDGGQPPRAPLRDLMARAVLRTPAGAEIRRRHRKYVEDLTERLRNGDYEALRDAVSLAATAAFLSLRLGGKHDALRPTPRLSPGGGGVPWGTTVQDHLREVYRTTAARLEREGRIDEAAFVLADLLDLPREAVALLERHGRGLTAAELAEGRRLDPALAVRLWWRAGRHDRAVDVARARGAFAEAVRLLAADDAAAAAELRAAWAHSRAEAGDFAGAVEAAWPEVSLRAGTLPWIRGGMAAGGPVAAHLFAYLLAVAPSDAARDAAVALVASADPARRAARDAFLDALVAVPAADPTVDREVCTAAVRAIVRADPPPVWAEAAARSVRRALRSRADPLLAEDLPPTRRPAASDEPAVVELPELPGELPAYDVVPLPGGVLVAHGEHGLRLLGADGRVRAHWDTPAHVLVPSDGGVHVTVVTALGGQAWELHRLDVTARRLRRWLPLRAAGFVPGYDGDLLPVVAPGGDLLFLDAAADRARTLWRELGDGIRAVACARSPDSLAAVVLVDAGWAQDARIEVWQWELPSRTLRKRVPVTFEPGAKWVLTSDGVVGVVAPHGDTGEPMLSWIGRSGRSTAIAPDSDVLASGRAAAVVRFDGSGGAVDVMAIAGGPVDVVARFPYAGDALDLRVHGGLAAVWDDTGRIAIVEPAARRVVGVLRTPA